MAGLAGSDRVLEIDRVAAYLLGPVPEGEEGGVAGLEVRVRRVDVVETAGDGAGRERAGSPFEQRASCRVHTRDWSRRSIRVIILEVIFVNRNARWSGLLTITGDIAN